MFRACPPLLGCLCATAFLKGPSNFFGLCYLFLSYYLVGGFLFVFGSVPVSASCWWTWRFLKCTNWYSCLLDATQIPLCELKSLSDVLKTGVVISAFSVLGVGLPVVTSLGGVHIRRILRCARLRLALVLAYVACMLGGFCARACMFSCCVFRFVGVPVGRSGPLVSLSSWSLSLSRSLFSLFLLPFLCLPSLPQHHTVIEESNQIPPSSISSSGSIHVGLMFL